MAHTSRQRTLKHRCLRQSMSPKLLLPVEDYLQYKHLFVTWGFPYLSSRRFTRALRVSCPNTSRDKAGGERLVIVIDCCLLQLL